MYLVGGGALMFGFVRRADKEPELSRLSTMLQKRRSTSGHGAAKTMDDQGRRTGETFDAMSLEAISVSSFFTEARLKIAAGYVNRAPKR